MGNLTLQIGALSRQISASDENMTDVLTEVVAATGGPQGGTATQRVDWVLQIVRRYLVDVANGQRRRAAVTAAEAGVQPVALE